MKHVYAAVFEVADEGGYTVSFPDLPGCYSQGDNLYEALTMAQSALSQWIEYLSDKKMQIPKPTDIENVKIESNGFASLIYADVRDGRAVKRTISLPKWMDEKVAENGLSLSRVLQDALASKFQK